MKHDNLFFIKKHKRKKEKKKHLIKKNKKLNTKSDSAEETLKSYSHNWLSPPLKGSIADLSTRATTRLRHAVLFMRRVALGWATR